jgi:outer membrane receptor for ferrienterochelin and colicins
MTNMTQFTHFISPPVVATLLFCQNGYAADAPPAATPPAAAANADVQKVEVTSSRTDGRRTDTTFKQTLGPADIVRYGDTSVLDVLRRQPGIVVNGIPGRKGGEISMRGLGSGYVRILLNGEAAPANFSLDNLAPDIVERIEISAVPSVELGTQAIAGTINIILKQGKTKRERQFKLGLQSDAGLLKPQASGTISQQWGKLSLLLTGAVRRIGGDETFLTQTQGFDQNGTLLRQLDQFNQDRGWNGNLASRINLKLDGENSLSLQSFVSKNHYNSAGHDRTAFLAGPITPFANDQYESTGTSSSFRNNLTWLQNVGASSKLEFKIGATWAHSRRASQIRFVEGVDTPTHLQNTQGNDDTRSLTTSAKLKTSYAEKHALVTGVELQRDNEDKTRVNLIDSVSQLTATGSIFNITTRRYALYLQDEWDINPRWSVYLGGRWEQTLLRSSNDLGQRIDNRQGIFSPVLQTVWRLPGTKSDQLRLGLARTLRLPPGASLIAGRSFSVVNTVTTPDTSGNPNLKPEIALGLDAAYEHYLNEDGLLSVNLFVRRISDIILTQTRLNGVRWVSQAQNDGNAVSRGIEIEAKFKLSQLFDQASASNVRINLARSWSAIDAIPGPDNRIGRQSPLSVNLSLDHSFKSVPVTAGATVGYVKNGEVRLSNNEWNFDSDNRTLESYVLWKFDPKTWLRVVASNLRHRDYVSGARYVSPELTQHRRSLTPTYTSIRAVMEFKL